VPDFRIMHAYFVLSPVTGLRVFVCVVCPCTNAGTAMNAAATKTLRVRATRAAATTLKNPAAIAGSVDCQ
jgi:hypothetical protein